MKSFFIRNMRRWPWNNAYQWSSWRPIIFGLTDTLTTTKSTMGLVFLLPGSFVVSSLLCHHHQQQKELFIITKCDDEDDDFGKHSQAGITTTTSTKKATREMIQIQRLNGISIPSKDDSDNIVFLDQVETMKKTKKKVPVGRISIWKDVTWQEEEEEEKIHRSRRSKRRMGSDYVQISYQGKYVKDANWIQFIKRDKWDKYGNLLLVDNEIDDDDDDDDVKDNNSNIQVDKYLWHRRGEWFLDAPRFARNPFYDTWGLHNRSDTELSIFDKPMGVLDPNLHSKLIIELDSYLILQNMVVWRIHWQVIETIENGREIHILCSCPADKIMDELIFFEEEEENHHTTWKIGYSHPNKADEDHTVFMKNNGYILTSSSSTTTTTTIT